MNKKFCLNTIFILCNILIANMSSAEKLYKWQDENGKTYYSDNLPASTVSQAHEELNEYGITTSEIEREKTDAEWIAEQEREQARQMLIAEDAKERARQRQRDQILLDTFTTERDLILTRDGRLEAIQGQITIMEHNQRYLNQQVSLLDARIKELKSNQKPIPKNWLKQHDEWLSELSKIQAFIDKKEKEYAAVKSEFSRDLRRFRELTTPSTNYTSQNSGTVTPTTEPTKTIQ